MTATLHAVPASHPVATVRRALELKGVPFREVVWAPVVHQLPQRLRFGARTVPGIVFDDGQKVAGSREILRELERRVPEPALYGGAGVDEAEAWGDEVLQPLVRRLVWQALSRDTSAQLTYTAGVKMRPPTPAPVVRLGGGALGWMERRIHKATPQSLADDLRALPGHLDRIDAWVADGTLGGSAPNAADLQIGASLRLATTLDDLAAHVDGRPAGELARRWFPEYAGHVPAGVLHEAKRA